MENLKKHKFATIALILLLTISIPFAALPAATAHDPPWTIATHAYLTVAPNPVGVGQQVFVTMWIDKPLLGGEATNDVRHRGYKLTITKPDGATEAKTWDIISDTTTAQFIAYVPDQVGQYSFVFDYAGIEYIWDGTSTQRTWKNDTYLPSTSRTVNLTVQDEQLPNPITSYPLPTEYWTRPIEGQNTDWWSISSHWLGGAQIVNQVQPGGSAPNSAHIMWTKPIQHGGVVGGNTFEVPGEMYYTGMSYNGRFAIPIIMNGILYYQEPEFNSGSGGPVKAVDLRTGAEIWSRTDIPSFAFGELLGAASRNQHGIMGEGLLYTNNFARAFDPATGDNIFNITGVPSGTAILGIEGETLRYQISTSGHWLAQWNSSRLYWTETSSFFGPSIGPPITANTADRYDWNVTIPSLPSGSTVRRVIYDDLLLFSNLEPLPPSSTDQTASVGVNDPYTVGAISLKASSRGTLLWMKTYAAPADNVVRYLRIVDPETRVFFTLDKQTFSYNGYSIDNGALLWGPFALPGTDNEYWSATESSWNQGSRNFAYGNLYSAGFGGLLYCINATTGELQWIYGNGGEGNSTFNGLSTAWGNPPIYIGAIADGKLYMFQSEHSPNTPMYKGALIRAINATTGEEIWTLPGWGTSGMFYSQNGAIADGYYTYLNGYDMQIYCIGKGPSTITVSIQDDVITYGDSVLMKGMITDISDGTRQAEQIVRFPDGVPAVSDASQSALMQYVYMQKPRPTDTTGVEIVVSVVDSNGNSRAIGSTTSDADGFFAFDWKPDIEGKYVVYASFAGSESYWPSHAVTSFVVDAAAATPAPTAAPQASTADMYFVPAVAAIIVAIAIGFAITILVLKKRP